MAYTRVGGRYRDTVTGRFVSAARARRSEAARRGWETRRARAQAQAELHARRSEAARRGWETRRARAQAQAELHARRSEAARRGWETRRRRAWERPKIETANAMDPSRRQAVAEMVAGLDVRDPWERHLARDVPPAVYVHEQALARMAELGYDLKNRDTTWRRAWGQVYRDQAIRYYATLTGLKPWQIKGLLKLGDLSFDDITDALRVVSPKRKKK